MDNIETLRDVATKLQDIIDFLEDMEMGECDNETVIDALIDYCALDSELEIYNVEVAGG